MDNEKNPPDGDKTMNALRIAGIFAALLIATALIAACTQTPAPGTGTAVITYKLYGGFVMPEYAIQELVVTKDAATFTIQSFDGNITARSEKNLTPEQYNGIVRVFTDNNFASFGDRYDEGQNYVTDVGFADITFAENGKSKTVTTYNVNDYMPAGLIAIRKKLQETVEFTRTLDGNQRRALTESWIRESPTYAYDGSGLTFVSDLPAGSDPVAHNLTYTFTSSHAGYGNRNRSGDCPGHHGAFGYPHPHVRRGCPGRGDRREMGRDRPVPDRFRRDPLVPADAVREDAVAGLGGELRAGVYPGANR